jgi:hypothetical protein
MQISNIRHILNEYCKDNDIQFFYGRSDYLNWAGDKEIIRKALLCEPISFVAELSTQGQWTDNVYTANMFYGCKSNLGDSYDQRYLAIPELFEELHTIISELACDNGFLIQSLNGTEFINDLDVNIDGIAITMQFKVY